MKRACLVYLLLSFSTTVAVQALTFTSDTLIDANNHTYEGQDIVVDGCTLTINGAHDFNSLQVINSGVVTHSAAPTGQPDYRINLTITQDVNVAAGCKISADGKGYGSSAPKPHKSTLPGRPVLSPKICG